MNKLQFHLVFLALIFFPLITQPTPTKAIDVPKSVGVMPEIVHYNAAQPVFDALKVAADKEAAAKQKAADDARIAAEAAQIKTREAVITPQVPSATVTAYHSDNEAMEFIFSKESGDRPNAIAPNGACGLGQSYPCSKLLSACGSLDNVQCQVDFFTSYAQKYGGWAGAMNFWQGHGWW